MKNKSVICIVILILILSILTFMTVYYEIKSKDMNYVFESEEVKNNENSNVESTNESVDNSEELKGAFINIESYDELEDYLKRDITSILVLGKTGCNFCDLYKPILEEVSSNYELEILYVDFKKIDETEYENIINSEITVPNKCTNYDEDTPLSKGFGTPLTLFIKEGLSYDCIRGYKEKGILINELKILNLIN